MFEFLKQLRRPSRPQDSSLADWEETYADDIAYLASLEAKDESRPVLIETKKIA